MHLALSFLLATVALPATEDSPTAPTSKELRRVAQKLRSTRLTAEERLDLEQQLRAAGTDGIALLEKALEEYVGSTTERFEDARKSYLRSYEGAARRWVKSSARRHSKEIEGLREELASLRRKGAALSKDDLYEVGDTALERLTDLLVVDSGIVLAEDEKLSARRDELTEIGFEVELASDRLAALRRGDAPSRSPLGSVLGDDGELNDLFDDGIERHDEPDEETDRFNALWTIERAEGDIALLAMPMSRTDRDVLLANRALADQLDEEEARGVEALNRVRLCAGLAVLRVDLRLTECCRDHSKDMRELGFFSHTSPVPGKRSFSQRAARFKTSARSENIAAGQQTGEGAIRAWWHSPGHHRNMLGGHSRIGLGRHETTWTQLFG